MGERCGSRRGPRTAAKSGPYKAPPARRDLQRAEGRRRVGPRRLRNPDQKVQGPTEQGVP
eukprot:10337541-Alexandrium_andersonii.AAC.1